MIVDPKDHSSRRIYHLLMSCVTPRPIARLGASDYAFLGAITQRQRPSK